MGILLPSAYVARVKKNPIFSVICGRRRSVKLFFNKNHYFPDQENMDSENWIEEPFESGSEDCEELQNIPSPVMFNPNLHAIGSLNFFSTFSHDMWDHDAGAHLQLTEFVPSKAPERIGQLPMINERLADDVCGVEITHMLRNSGIEPEKDNFKFNQQHHRATRLTEHQHEQYNNRLKVIGLHNAYVDDDFFNLIPKEFLPNPIVQSDSNNDKIKANFSKSDDDIAILNHKFKTFAKLSSNGDSANQSTATNYQGSSKKKFYTPKQLYYRKKEERREAKQNPKNPKQ